MCNMRAIAGVISTNALSFIGAIPNRGYVSTFVEHHSTSLLPLGGK